jgi:RNA polymerase sigma-70 factor (ECF subfamily)
MATLENDLAGALAGNPAAVRAVIAGLTPVIQARAVRALSRRGRQAGRDPRQELGDLVQEVFLQLFRDDGRVLRGWQPEKGLSLLNFVGLVAEREVARIARSGRRSPWALDPTEDSDLEVAVGAVDDVERTAGSRDLFDQVYERLEEELHPKALELFRLLVIDDLPVPTVCETTGLTADQVYNWRSRLLKRAREILAKLDPISRPGPGPSGPIPGKRVTS